jgi:GT2 family glycosyltransferase
MSGNPLKRVIRGLPSISIIVLTYNGKRFVKDCLGSLQNIYYPKKKYEIIVVDNASSDGTAEYIQKHFKKIKIIKLDRNYGFAEGNNRGIKFCKGEFIIFLNQDTKVDKHWLIELVKPAIKDKKVGICGSLIRDFYRPQLVQDAANYLDIFGNVIHKGWGEKNVSILNPLEVFSVSGASLLIRRSILNKLKYCFDPSYFLYFEETDLCWRVNLLGYKVVFTPFSIVYHKAPIHPLSVKPINIFLYTRNKIISFRKNLRFPLRQLLLSLVLIRTFFAVVYWKYKKKWNFGLKFLGGLFSPITQDINLKKIPLKKQLSVFSFPSIKKYIDFFSFSRRKL